MLQLNLTGQELSLWSNPLVFFGLSMVIIFLMFRAYQKTNNDLETHLRNQKKKNKTPKKDQK